MRLTLAPMAPSVRADLVRRLEAAGYDVELGPEPLDGPAGPGVTHEVISRIALDVPAPASASALANILWPWAMDHFGKQMHRRAGIKVARIYGPDGRLLAEVHL